MNETEDQAEPSPRPWWKYPMVWMVIAGPACVVVAGFVTLWIALTVPDPVLAEDYYRQGVEINRTLAERRLVPALVGRNHAATPATTPVEALTAPKRGTPP